MDRLAQGFFRWLDRSFDSLPVPAKAPLVVNSLTPAPSVEIPVDCVNGTLSVPATGWSFNGADHLVPGIRIKWGYSSNAVNSFTVMSTAGASSLADACSSYPSAGYAEGGAGVTRTACELNAQSAGKTFAYTIATTSASCKASSTPFQLPVPANSTVATRPFVQPAPPPLF